MSDLIKREDAIKAINKALDRETLLYGLVRKIAVDAIRSTPSADRPQGWIPCSERLPKPYTEVLVCDECGWISLGSYRPCDVTEKDSGWSTHTKIKMPTDEVFAWMYLPEPWEGADDE